MHILKDPSRFVILAGMDFDLAEKTRKKGCLYCGGPLHYAPFLRKPRLHKKLDSVFRKRYSLCCGREGCRRRVLPPSLIYLGRRVYLGVLVVLLTALSHGLTPRRRRRVCGILGVAPRTLERWRIWWKEEFPQTPFWRSVRGVFLPPLDEELLPAPLVAHFSPSTPKKLAQLMRFLAFP